MVPNLSLKTSLIYCVGLSGVFLLLWSFYFIRYERRLWSTRRPPDPHPALVVGTVPPQRDVMKTTRTHDPEADMDVLSIYSAGPPHSPIPVTIAQDKPGLPLEKEASHDLPSPTSDVKVELFPAWTTSDPHDETFIRRFYLYSATVALHHTPPIGSEVHFVGFQEGRVRLNITCCFKLSPYYQSNTVYRSGSRAILDYAENIRSFQTTTRETGDLTNVGVVYRCRFPFSNQQLRGGHVTMTSSASSCPSDVRQYMPVYSPEVRPGELALCSKIAYGLRLDPNKLVEWFEMQRLLGVDRVLLYDLNNTETVYRVFRHYQDLGLLELLPYKLPGRPWGRFVLKDGKDWTRFGDDKDLVVWNCRLRLAGYQYVVGLDLDEVIVPRQYDDLKLFLKDEFSLHKGKAASLYFKVQFFLETWGPVDPHAPLLFLRYLNSTYPGADVHKHAYIPSRTHMAGTHWTSPYDGYRKVKFVNPARATVFHYRTCKYNWASSICSGARLPDHSMQRFQNRLVPAVTSLRKKFGLILP